MTEVPCFEKTILCTVEVIITSETAI